MTERPMIAIRKEVANELISRLLKRDIIDKRYHIRRSGDTILIPVKDKVPVDGFVIGMDNFRIRELGDSPHNSLEKVKLKSTSRYFVPRKWIRLGDSIVIKSKDGKIPSKRALKILLSFTGPKAVYLDISRIRGIERMPGLKLIHGESHEVVHRENGILYRFDPQKVMFSPGNVNVRGILRNRNLEGMTVLDMFAGIGYFALPCAKYSGAKSVYVSEINPVSYRYLIQNISINGLESRVLAENTDCRNSWGSLKADLIIMGHFLSLNFLSSALIRSHEGTEIVMHVLTPTGEISQVQREIIAKALNLGYILDVLDSRVVKSYSPHNWHYQVTLKVFSCPKGKA